MVVISGGCMTKRSFVVISILSLISTYIASTVSAISTGTLLAGESGFPFKDTRATLFGQGSISGPMFILNIAFWFLVILGIWKILQKVVGKK